MSIYYSKFSLNTYRVTPYFHAHIPDDYPLLLVLQKSRAFRRLPPRLRELSALAKKWAQRSWPIVTEEMKRWYDADGYELDPDTGHRLTDEEINEQWSRPSGGQDGVAKFVVEDIPLPAGGFADPDTWEPTIVEEIELVDRGLTMGGVLSDIASRGRERTAEEYAAPADWRTRTTSDEDLARIILDMEGKPWPPAGDTRRA